MTRRKRILQDGQTTLATAISCHGIGLHTGMLVNMTLKPAPCDFGIVFLRTDVNGVNTVRACRGRIIDTTLSTSLGNGRVHVQTVEHLLAALSGLGVDNVLVEIDAAEVPIMDGSALPFVHLIRRAGLRKQRKPRSFLKVIEPVEVSDGDKHAVIFPSEETEIVSAIDFSHPRIGRQDFSWTAGEASFVRDIAPARTFGFKKELDWLISRGFARGGSLDNAVVLDNEGIINDEGLRFEDEFVRHKILDAVGDLSLAGHPIIGRLEASKSGHTLNARLVETLLESRNSWRIIEGVGTGLFVPVPEPAARLFGQLLPA
jgi:UDP-3-O-[3-hydroxymyristoyl] N-acetylglucosamine deacetylase